MIAGVLALLMFLGASILDLRERRVANRYWLPFLVAAALLLVVEPFDWRVYAWIGAQWVIFYVLWRVGLLFGGADAKALMVLAALWVGLPGVTTLGPAIDVLVNGLLVMMLLPVGYALWNALHLRFGLHSFLAVPMDLGRAQQKYVWPLERVVEGNIRRKFMQNRAESMVDVYRSLRQAGVETVWATPKVPFMVPLLMGVILQLSYGNALFGILNALIAP